VSATPTAPSATLPALPAVRAAPHDQRPGPQRRQNLTKETAKQTPTAAAA